MRDVSFCQATNWVDGSCQQQTITWQLPHEHRSEKKKHVRLPASAVEGICNDGIWGTFFSGKAMLVLFKSGEPAFPDSP